MKKIIVTQYFVKSFEFVSRVRGIIGQDMYMISHDYTSALMKEGFLPLVLPILDDESYIEEAIKISDGLLLTGGEDVSSFIYGKPLLSSSGIISVERDKFELTLLKKALKRGIPILGICRGLQIITVFFGGTLNQNINKLTDVKHWGERGDKTLPAHKVTIKDGSILYDLYKKNELWVNSFHNQAVEKKPENLHVSATSEDGIIEALENKDKKILGVQWHPEMMYESYKEHLKIFKFFNYF